MAKREKAGAPGGVRGRTPEGAKAGVPGRRENPLAAPKRRRPQQQRAKATVEQILNAAVGVLEQGGFEAMTMQTIADAAGINIATAYSYFPNKHHVLAHLARARLDERLTLLEAAFARLKADEDWIDGFCATLAELYRLRVDQAGSVALRQAMHASPSLWQIDQEGNRRAGILVADLLRAHAGDGVGGETGDNRQIQGRVIAEYVTATLDYLQHSDAATRAGTLAEIIALTRAYLERIARPAAGPAEG